jgi:hypothetical protein
MNDVKKQHLPSKICLHYDCSDACRHGKSTDRS